MVLLNFQILLFYEKNQKLSPVDVHLACDYVYNAGLWHKGHHVVSELLPIASYQSMADVKTD